jgi:bifunctional DNA-binding transcriptional regulator/antitoxin component of YhaV-PrlF toxin-antitoxin module
MRRKSSDPNIVALDKQRRICLTREMLLDFGANPKESILLTLDPEGLILIFKSDEDLRACALSDCRKMPEITDAQAAYLFSYHRTRSTIDSRGRIIIPETFLIASGISESARVIPLDKHLVVASSEKASSVYRRLCRIWTGHTASKSQNSAGSATSNDDPFNGNSTGWRRRLPFKGN